MSLNILNCDYFNSGSCGSCTELKSPLPESREAKLAVAHSILSPFITSDTTLAPLIAADPFGSRTRCKMAVGSTFDNPSVGIITAEQKVNDISLCPLHTNLIREIIGELKSTISRYKLYPYQVDKRAGELKYILLHSNGDSSQVILRFVLRSTESVTRIAKAIPDLQTKFPQIRVITANIQPQHAAIIEGEDEIVLTKESLIWDSYNSIPISFTHKNFSQVTHSVAEQLYKTVAELICKENPTGLLDLFCGAGCFSLLSANHFKWSIGIEISPQAIEAAKLSAQRNNFQHCEFITGDAFEIANSYRQKKFDLIVVNPPRRGLGAELVDLLSQLDPTTIIYSSCNLQSLAQDLLPLTNSGYQLNYLQGFDMFPLTKHLETLVMLTRTNSQQKECKKSGESATLASS